MEPRKKPEANLDKMVPFYIVIGLVMSLSLTLVAFEWRTFEETITELMNNMDDEEIEETIIATMTAPPPPPPPPPPSVVEVLEIVEDDVVIEEEIEFNQDVDENTEVTESDFSGEEETTTDDNEIFEIVENYPRFKGCEKEKTEEDAQLCFQKKLAAFLSKNIQYPPQAKDLGIQGKVFIQFVIEKDGSVSNVTVLRGIGSGCDEEAVRVVKKLPKFTPARQRGRPVRLMYRLPIQFKLS